MKQSKMDELSVSLNRLRRACVLACCQVELSGENEAAVDQTVDPIDLNKVVKTTKKEIDTFLSKIIHGQTKTTLLGNNINLMMQSLKGGDGPHLPHVLSVVNTYTKVTSGNK